MAVTIIFIEANGTEHPVDAEPGLSVMEAAIWNGVPVIEAVCGGSVACGTCLVDLEDRDAAGLSPMAQAEADLLAGHEGAGPNSRLSCQLCIGEATDGLRLLLPEKQREF